MNPLHRILRGTWRANFGKTLYPCILGSANYRAPIADAASIQNLHAAAFTAEGWFQKGSAASYQMLFFKGNTTTLGWKVIINTNGTISGIVYTDTTSSAFLTSDIMSGLAWKHIAVTYDDAGDRRMRCYANGLLVATGNAGTGTIMSDVGQDGQISYSAAGLSGYHGWVRWSNKVRYTTTFAAPPRMPLPVKDGDEVGLWYANEMTGAEMTDYSDYGNRATLAGTYTWKRH